MEGRALGRAMVPAAFESLRRLCVSLARPGHVANAQACLTQGQTSSLAIPWA